MLADIWNVSGWVIGAVSLVIAVIEWISKKFADKDKEALRSHLRSIYLQLEVVQANLAETHKAEDVVKTDAGKRFLSSVAYQVAALRMEVAEALGQVVLPTVQNVKVENHERP